MLLKRTTLRFYSFNAVRKVRHGYAPERLMFEDAFNKGFPVERLQIFNALAQAGV